MTNQVPFRKKVKDNLQGAGVIASGVTVIGTIARYNGFDFSPSVIGWGLIVAIASFAIAASIKPKKWRETVVASGTKNHSEW
ncbi:MAG: hypothetical protein JJ858_17465 [Rhizobiaceae bacterium]|nr:hypothetical protein [Rhizobiaceae bacterium]